jgi:hypothetical protein
MTVMPPGLPSGQVGTPRCQDGGFVNPKRQLLRIAAAANGSSRIAPRSPRLTSISPLTCSDDLYRPSCHSFTPRGQGSGYVPVPGVRGKRALAIIKQVE